jgi:hypothetical protein
MRVPHHSENGINVESVIIHDGQHKSPYIPALNTYIEKKIEHLYYRSEKFGWNFADFCTHVLEVLVVLQHRKKAKRLAASKQRAGRTARAQPRQAGPRLPT